MKYIILFDGECNFCDSSVQFIIKRDPEAKFNFAAINSPIGADMISKFQLSNVDSLVLVHEDKCYTKSTAALKIAKELNSPLKATYLFIIVPKPLRDPLYDFIARNRYKWFGKKEVCNIPSKEDRQRFI